MEKIISAMPFYYGASDEAPNTFVIKIKMKDEIEGAVLEDIIPKVMKRYPYFMVKIGIKENEYILEDNLKPIVVKKGREPAVLGGKETNEHLLAFSYEKDTISLSVFHGLADAGGILPLVRTVLYYYCCEHYHIELEPGEINLIDSPIEREEVEDPYPEKVDESISPIGRYNGKAAFQLEEGGKFQNKKDTAYLIKIPENSFIKYTKAKDGSPATMVSVFLYRALSEIHSLKEQSIVCGMAMNIRSVLQKPKCHHSVVSQLFLEYKPFMKKMDVQMLSTCSRGMVLVQSQPENVWISVRNNLAFFERLRQLPDVPSKKAFMQQIVKRSMHRDTYKVSYAGRAKMGSVEPYICSMDSYIDITGAGIMVEVNAVNGWLNLCFMQEFEEDIYVNSFLRQLDKEGISYVLESREAFEVPKVCF